MTSHPPQGRRQSANPSSGEDRPESRPFVSRRLFAAAVLGVGGAAALTRPAGAEPGRGPWERYVDQLPMVTYAQSLGDLVAVSAPDDGQVVYVDSYFPLASYSADAQAIGELGGGLFVWRADAPRAGHNGGTVLSPTVPGAGDPASLTDYLAGTGDQQPAANGCWVREHDRTPSPTWFGARINADVDNTASLAALVSAVVASGERDIAFPAGTIQYSASPNFGHSDLRVRGAGRTNTVLKYTGADKAFVIDGGEFGPQFLNGVSVSDLTIEGNADAQVLLFSDQSARMRITDIGLREANSQTGVALALHASVATRVESVVCSINEQAMANRPHTGILLGRAISRPEHMQCSTNTFIDVMIEGATGVGIHLEASDQAMFLGGTSEANLGGTGVVIDDVCRYNSFIGMGCESNAQGDFLNAGISTQFINCYTADLLKMLPSSRHAVIEGGMHHRIEIDPGASHTKVSQLAFGYWAAATAGFFDQGVYTSVEGLLDTRATAIPDDPSPWRGNYVSQLAPPAVTTPATSPHTITNTSGGTTTVTIAGGTVNTITFTRDGVDTIVGGGSSGLPTAGAFALAPADELAIDFSDAPTVLTVEGLA
jgi:hypothetical protein